MTGKNAPETPGIELTLDRVEEGTAVLLTPDSQRLVVPASVLPPGTREGDTLIAVLELFPEAGEARLERIRALRGRLLDGGGSNV
jgi:hypothetical protein